MGALVEGFEGVDRQRDRQAETEDLLMSTYLILAFLLTD